MTANSPFFEFLELPLFVRTNRKLHLTEKGKLFYERAQAIVSLFDRTKAEIRSDDEMTGEIRIASGETVTKNLINIAQI